MSSKGILFDLDGTLWDSSAEVAEAWSRCIEEKTDRPERVTQSDLRGLMGKTLEAIAAEMFPTLPQTEQIRLIRLCEDSEMEYLLTHKPIFFKGEEALLRLLEKDYRLAIVSNCQEGYIEIYLGHCGYPELFCDFESAGATGLSKGGNIQLVMQRNGIDDCIYVGDTRGDELAAREAGVKFIHAAYGFGKAEAPDGVINDISELAAEARRLFGEDKR